MNTKDKILLINKLNRLNAYEDSTLQDIIKIRDHWEKRVKEYGRDKSSGNLEMTYGEMLDMNIRDAEYYKGLIEENQRLIRKLGVEKWSD